MLEGKVANSSSTLIPHSFPRGSTFFSIFSLPPPKRRGGEGGEGGGEGGGQEEDRRRLRRRMRRTLRRATTTTTITTTTTTTTTTTRLQKGKPRRALRGRHKTPRGRSSAAKSRKFQ